MHIYLLRQEKYEDTKDVINPMP